ncbi:transmembrane sensor [Pseudomonas sp. TE3786]
MSRSYPLRVVADAPPSLEQVALTWHERLRGQPTAAERKAFDQWLYAEPAHVEAYAQVQALWARTEQAAQQLAREEAPALQEYLRAMDAPRPRAPRWWLGSVAMAASVLLMLGLLGWQPQRWVDSLRADYVSAAGQLRQITLADQSVLLLDADSAVQVHFTARQRRIELLRGAVYFQVSHTGQPFIVSAADGEVQVLGTQFEVRLRGDGAQVTVQSGRVAVTAKPGETPQVLGANQQMSYQQGLAGSVQGVDSDASLAWRQGWLTFYQVPLTQVLDEVQRYSAERIVLLNPALGQQRISGSFPSQDADKVLASLATVVGFQRQQMLGLTVLH